MKFFRKLLIILLVLATSSFSIDRIDFTEGRYNNVCKSLTDNALLYMIFIDSKETSPWTEFDIRTTLDSMETAVQWIENLARENNIKLNILTDYYIGEEFTTIRKRLPNKSVIESINTPNLEKGIESLNAWGDRIARMAGSSLPIDKKDGIPEIEKPRNKERLIAYLRDKHNVESVALLFMLNNYFKEDISVPINTLISEDVEFAIVSYKYPSEIAHNFLHLYGACDVDESPYRRSKSKIEIAKKMLPDDIMQDPYAKSLNTLEISDFTKYMIGWSDTLDPIYQPLLKDVLTIDF
jgi:hypothetical protein